MPKAAKRTIKKKVSTKKSEKKRSTSKGSSSKRIASKRTSYGFSKMTLVQLKKTKHYKDIPRRYAKSKMNVGELRKKISEMARK
jgi:hypothetical protein